MEDFRISRRQGLKALGVTVGAAVLGAGVVSAANAAPAVRQGKPGKGGTKYSLTVLNDSTDFEHMCVYQSDPEIGVPDVMSLAWFSKPAEPNTQVVFEWTIDYSFVWSETGVLIPGVTFDASQTWPADPRKVDVSNPKEAGNQIGLSHPDPGAYTFTSTGTSGAQAGTLYVSEDGSIPLNEAAVGIGMSGSGTYVVQSQPNQLLTFTPTPIYYLNAGTFTQGQVMGVGVVDGSVAIQFPPNSYQASAVLQQDNTWSVKYG